MLKRSRSLSRNVEEAINTILLDDQLFDLYKNFGGVLFRRSSVLDGFGSFLKRIDIHGDTCIEIGTRHGLTAVLLSRYFKRVHSIDIVESGLKHEVLKYLGIKNITFHTVTDNYRKERVIRRIKFDGAYVDADHEKDSFLDFKLVGGCKRVIFHEAQTSNEVKQLLDGLPKKNVLRHDNFAYWHG